MTEVFGQVHGINGFLKQTILSTERVSAQCMQLPIPLSKLAQFRVKQGQLKVHSANQNTIDGLLSDLL